MTRMDDLKKDLDDLRGEVRQLATDVRWLKLIGGAIAIASFSPKIGGPSAATVVQAVVGLFT